MPDDDLTSFISDNDSSSEEDNLNVDEQLAVFVASIKARLRSAEPLTADWEATMVQLRSESTNGGKDIGNKAYYTSGSEEPCNPRTVAARGMRRLVAMSPEPWCPLHGRPSRSTP